MIAVLNENGMVVDHAVLSRGDYIPREEQEEMVNRVIRLMEGNDVDAVVMNTALHSQTIILQRLLSSRLHAQSVGVLFVIEPRTLFRTLLPKCWCWMTPLPIFVAMLLLPCILPTFVQFFPPLLLLDLLSTLYVKLLRFGSVLLEDETPF